MPLVCTDINQPRDEIDAYEMKMFVFEWIQGVSLKQLHAISENEFLRKIINIVPPGTESDSFISDSLFHDIKI